MSGAIGSGKTTTANRVAELLGYERFSAGNVMRQIARDKGISAVELAKEGVSNPEIDKQIDDALKAQGSKSNIVIDSRLGFHFIPHSFRVFLDLPQEVAATRIIEDKKVNSSRDVEQEIGYDNVLAAIRSRTASDLTRYKEYYDVEMNDHNNYDLVLSSEHLSIGEVAQTIVCAYERWRRAQ